jgi:hypothetical protein
MPSCGIQDVNPFKTHHAQEGRAKLVEIGPLQKLRGVIATIWPPCSSKDIDNQTNTAYRFFTSIPDNKFSTHGRLAVDFFVGGVKNDMMNRLSGNRNRGPSTSARAAEIKSSSFTVP